MNKFENDVDGKDWLDAELADTLDEDYEFELSEPALREETRKIYNKTHPPTIERTQYFRHLLALQAELIKLQAWVKHTKAKIIVIFEGRDAAGKGGVIKRITQRLNPRVCRVVALPAPTEREKTQWYFERYVSHLPASGEIVLFDRSRVRWEDYTKAKEDMFTRTNIPEAPWFIVEANDKKRARLNCIDHLLHRVPYTPVPHEEVTLPSRVCDPNYERHNLPSELYVPQKY